jgi:diaminohydroxyphosphoribosylaminopyrimidine deaminase/5-amino-6-(5-phosphoribosylamino)uracil reductase
MTGYFDTQDKTFLNLALNSSKKNIGLTGSNPSVGCVLVKDGSIISIGVTQRGGTPHSENIAINKAVNKSSKIEESTLYVSLEPCSHFGKTPPCTDLIIKSKISRVVIAATDPDKRVNGLGIEKLRQAGIKVEVGLLEEQAKQVNQGFFTAKTLHRPFITLKLATSLDEKIAQKNGHSKWITCEKSRQYSHYLRAKNDAILVGANTVKQDNPMLNCRIAGLEDYSPKRIIISSNLDIDLSRQLIKTANQIPTIIATNNQNNQQFTNLGVKIINFKTLNNLAEELCKIGINNLLIEGGGKTATAFLKANLIDKIIWIKSNKTIGPDGIKALENQELSKLEATTNFTKICERTFNSDIMQIYTK